MAKGADVRAAVQKLADALSGLLEVAGALEEKEAVEQDVHRLSADREALLSTHEACLERLKDEKALHEAAASRAKVESGKQIKAIEDKVADLAAQRDRLEAELAGLRKKNAEEATGHRERMDREAQEHQAAVLDLEKKRAAAQKAFDEVKADARAYHAAMGERIQAP